MAAPDDQSKSRQSNHLEEPRPRFTRAEKDEMWKNARLSLPSFIRIPLASTMSFMAGFTLGSARGGKSAGLQFRAEHAHKLPTSTTGWYLYHKSKNYQVAYSGVREGLKMGCKVSIWTTAMVGIELMFDSYRQTSDFLNTVTSCVTVAGAFSLWNRFSLPMTARTTKAALVAGIVYGGLQDAVGVIRGRPIGYVDWIRSRLGSPREEKFKSQ
ncbi:hypothetical protein N0V88_007918 [Collariella sp. IMI 366227]|nr:hypothetical protein N0V88_007918 [Collariella sp. IMI 366227]